MTNWIRRKITPPMMEAIKASDRSTHVFYITGKGGEGKTILLRQIGMELGSPDGIAPHFGQIPWSGILDLYHPDVNTNSGLETYIIGALERSGEFQPFRVERDAYVARREAGVADTELEEERAHLAEVFAQCLNTVTTDRRIVIALDTVERMQHEVDEVQQLCGIEDESTSVKPWLLDQLLRWQNCVVLLAGRPEKRGKYLERALAQHLAGNPQVHYEHKKLEEFDEEETLEFLKRQEAGFPALCDLDETIRHRMHRVTDGRPIRLELMLNVIQHGLGFDRLWRETETLSAREAQEIVDPLLIELVMNGEADPALRDILGYLAVARRGLDAELLQHLAGGWDLATCQRRLAAISERSFVKRRPDDGRLFLHDEMSHLCDEHRLKGEDIQELSGRIAAWYDKKIADAKADLHAVPRHREQQVQHYQVESLLYRLRADPRGGYEWYAQQAHSAILNAQVGFDMRLRNELLAFLQSDSAADKRILSANSSLRREISCDCAARWVVRYLSRGRTKLAVEIAEKIATAPDGPDTFADPHFCWPRAYLAVYHANALIYLGRVEQAVEILKAVIAELEGGQPPELLAQQDPHTPAGWRHNLIRGRAHNNLGYAYRMQRHYELALREFRVALVYFRPSDLFEETANTDDNTGRVHAALYRRSHAEVLVEDGLQLRRAEDRMYRVAFSLTSRSLVHLAFGEPHRARRMAEEALAICEGLEVEGGAQRGIGIASLALGRAFRHLGALWAPGIYEPRECENLFRDALRHLNRARGIFEKEVGIPVRLIETYNELGCIYREWAAMARSLDPNSPLAPSLDRDAVQNLTRGLLLAQEQDDPVLYVDCCEDLAQAYFGRGDLVNTDIWLRRGEDTIPLAYKIEAGTGLQPIAVEECIEEFWQLMGKIELLRGHLEYERGVREDQGKVLRPVVERMTQHYAFAAEYFQRYSERAVRLESTFKQVYSRFKRCRIEDIRDVQERLLPNLKDRYKLTPEALAQFFEDTLGIAMQL